MEINPYFHVVWVVRRWIWLIAISAIVAGGASWYASSSMPPTYRTSVIVMVGEDASNPNVSNDQLNVSQRMAAGYAGIVRQQSVLDGTVKSLGLQIPWWKLLDQVLAFHAAGSSLVEIRVTDGDPRQAKAIADEIARQVVLQSPTGEYERQMEERRQFVQQQLDSLQAQIRQADADMVQKQEALKNEKSARGVMGLQDEIKALNLNASEWRNTYASLLSASQVRGSNTLRITQPAFVPTEPVSPNVLSSVLMAMALGLVLALAAVGLLEYINDTLNTVEDVARVSALPTMGVIQDAGEDPVEIVDVTGTQPSPVSEAYRVLRTNIRSAWEENGTLVCLVTSPVPGEGKSTVAANLAASFALCRASTILVDADLRHPSIHTLFERTNEAGLTSLLLAGSIREIVSTVDARSDRTRSDSDSDRGDLKRRLQARLVQTAIPDLWLLPSGPLPPSPADLLGSPVADGILEALRKVADVVILDCPPVLGVADTAILAGKQVGVLLVAEAGRTRAADIRHAKQILLRARANVLGVVLNRATRSGFDSNIYSNYAELPGRRLSLRNLTKTSISGLRTAAKSAVRHSSRGRQGVPEHPASRV